MQKLIVNILVLLLCVSFSACVLADADELNAEQIYNKIIQNKRLSSHPLAPWLQTPDSIKKDIERSNENPELEKSLETKANRGEPSAMFYLALLKTDEAGFHQAMGQNLAISNMIDQSNDEYDYAVKLFKMAGDAGISAAYWNIAVAYANGHGRTSSKLAAIEWYYKAGAGYLKAGDRENALAALVAIQAIRKDSDLGKRLEKQLNKGAPK